MNKLYSFNLPYYNPGYDLDCCIEIQNTPDLPKAISAHIYLLEDAIQSLKRLRALAVDVPEISINADPDQITVQGPSDKLDPLVKDGYLEEINFEWEEDTVEYDMSKDFQDAHVPTESQEVSRTKR